MVFNHTQYHLRNTIVKKLLVLGVQFRIFQVERGIRTKPIK